MPEIPKQLQERGYRFCLIPSGKKNPIETNWTTTNNYEFDDPKLLKHLSEGGNYGVVCGFNGLVVLDTDTQELTEAVIKAVPETFKVKTGTGNFHFYFRCPTFSTGKIPLTMNETKKHYGDLQAWGSQVVGAGSLHPNGNFYSVETNSQIAAVDKNVLMDLIAPFRDAPKMDLVLKNGIDIPITNIINLAGLKDRKNGEYQGTHPYHGSTTEWNFTVNPIKNVWHCYRCGSGGGPIQLIGVIEGIVPCDNPILRGEDFFKVMEIAERRYGYKPPVKSAFFDDQTTEKTKTEDKTAWTFEELMAEPRIEQKYVVNPLIPEGRLIMIGGRPESGKSIFSLFMSLSIAAGNKFFGFPTSKLKCLYLDAEMGKVIVQDRIRFMNNVYKFNTEGRFTWKTSDMKGIIEETGKDDYNLIIIDSYRRFLKGAENDSETVNMFFKSVLKPLLKGGKTVILIHHFRKKSKELSDDDVMELFRGSSDTVAQLDLAYGLFKDGEQIDGETGIATRSFSLCVVKNRLGLPLTDFSFTITKDDKREMTRFDFAAFKKEASTNDALKVIIIDLLKDGNVHETREIKEAVKVGLDVDISHVTLNTALTELLDIGKVVRIKRGSWKLSDQSLHEFLGMEPAEQ